MDRTVYVSRTRVFAINTTSCKGRYFKVRLDYTLWGKGWLKWTGFDCPALNASCASVQAVGDFSHKNAFLVKLTDSYLYCKLASTVWEME